MYLSCRNMSPLVWEKSILKTYRAKNIGKRFMRRKADAGIPFGEGSCISISKFSLQHSDLLVEWFVGRRWELVAFMIAFGRHVVFLSLNRRLLQLLRLVQYLIDVSSLE